MRFTTEVSFSNELQSERCLWEITRRELMTTSRLFVTGLSGGIPFAKNSNKKVRFGIVTDVHFAETDSRTSRYYRESTAKMAECVALMNEEKVDFLIELGDFKDQNYGAIVSEIDSLKNLQIIENEFSKFRGPRYHVLGNHDTDNISKEQFLSCVENTGVKQYSKYYSFDSKGLHFIVLDANYKIDGADYDHGNFHWKDANVPSKELNWLKTDLASTRKQVIVFIHQPLDIQCQQKFVRNATIVRQHLQQSKAVLAVFQGHNHVGHYSNIEGIHYYTLKAMVEGSGEKNNSYAIVEVNNNNQIAVTGYRNALSKKIRET